MILSSEGEIRLRKIAVDDWPLWRKLRLEALDEAAYAFSSKLVDWQGQGDTEARWRGRLSDVPLNIVAEWRNSPAGMASATSVTPNGSVELISMWVAPFARGHGIGDSLVKAVIEWARTQQALSVALAVFQGNEHARALYRRHGFTDIGDIVGVGSGPNARWRVVYCKSSAEVLSANRDLSAADEFAPVQLPVLRAGGFRGAPQIR